MSTTVIHSSSSTGLTPTGDQLAEARHLGVEPAQEREQRALRRAGGPGLVGILAFGGEPSGEEVDQVAELAHRMPGAGGESGCAARVATRSNTNDAPSGGGASTTPPGSFSSGWAQRASCTRTRCSTKPTWVLASSSSAKQKRRSPWRMKSAGGQP